MHRIVEVELGSCHAMYIHHTVDAVQCSAGVGTTRDLGPTSQISQNLRIPDTLGIENRINDIAFESDVDRYCRPGCVERSGGSSS